MADRIRGCDRLTLLVNNAGFGVDALFHKSALGRQSAMARLHVLAPTHLTHAALPGIVATHRARSGHQCVVCGGLSARVGQRDVLRDEGVPQQFLRQLISRLDRHRRARAGVVPGFTYTEFHDVMGMNRGVVPKYLWLQADYVIEQSLRNLEHAAA